MSRKQVAVRVKVKAKELGEKKYPNYRTVYRVLQPIIDAQESKPKIRSVGWRGSSLSVKTRNGEYLNVEYSNHVWQCDHTKVDILLVDEFGELVDRPWLTLEKLVVRYIVDNYNQRIDARLGDRTRYQRWEAGLLSTPHLLSDRELDICLMKQTNRSIYRDGYIRFENIAYKGENLAGYAGERVALRYDPSDITQVLVYRREQGKDVFLARAFAQDLETETLSLEEIKATNKKIRDKGKSISNYSILEEVKERNLFVAKKTTKKEKRKQEQFEFNTEKVSKTTIETESEIEETTTYVEPEPVEILDYEDAMDEFGW